MGDVFSGLTGKTKSDFQGSGARFATYVNVYNHPSLHTSPEDRVRVGDGERQTRLRLGDVLFTASSETADEVGMSSSVVDEPAEPLYLNSFCFGFRPADPTTLHPRYSKHLFRARVMRDQIIKTGSGVTRINVSKARFKKIIVPLPSWDEQMRLADVLDSFESLVSDLNIGLPAELMARRRQYEYYRDRLLTFPEKAA